MLAHFIFQHLWSVLAFVSHHHYVFYLYFWTVIWFYFLQHVNTFTRRFAVCKLAHSLAGAETFEAPCQPSPHILLPPTLDAGRGSKKEGGEASKQQVVEFCWGDITEMWCVAPAASSACLSVFYIRPLYFSLFLDELHTCMESCAYFWFKNLSRWNVIAECS